jgi:hypothetical protein
MSDEKIEKKEESKVTDNFKKAIESYLTEYSVKDKLFAKNLKKEDKNIDDCINYILNHVKESKQIGFDDKDIFKLARHYYDEGDLGKFEPITELEIVWNQSVMPSEEDRLKEAEKAREHVFQEEIAKRLKKKPVKAVASIEKKSSDEPLSLF